MSPWFRWSPWSRARRGALAAIVLGALGASVAAQAAAPPHSELRPAEAPETTDELAELPLDRPLDRRALIAAVLARNPSVEAARLAWRAARERVPQATALDDPMAELGTAPLSLVTSGSRIGFQAGASQRFPWPGTLDRRGEVARAEAAAAGEGIDEVRVHLAALASLLFDQYYLVAQGLEINREHRLLLEDFQRVAVSRYATGLAPQQAPLQAEVEAAHLMHEEVVLRTRRRALGAQINALLHRPPGAPLPPAPETLEPVPEPELPAGELVAAALARRPELRAQRARIQARQAAVELERLDAYPGFAASTSYNSMWATGDHRWMVGVAVNVPIWRGRLRAQVAEAEARLGAEESALASLEDAVRVELEVALAELDEAEHVVHLYANRVLPAARDQIAAARSGFVTGAATMLALIDAERTLRSAELEYHRAQANAASRRAELDRALGRLPFAAGETPLTMQPMQPAQPGQPAEETDR